MSSNEFQGSNAASMTGSGVEGAQGDVAGGQQQAASGEKQDWLDKGITAAGKKFGVNVVRASPSSLTLGARADESPCRANPTLTQQAILPTRRPKNTEACEIV